jgi:hypothetical protein
MNEKKEISCYTYKVEMVVHLFASTEKEASDRLDKDGGQISSRKTTLLDSVNVSVGTDVAGGKK